MSCWTIAICSNVAKKSILKAVLGNHMAYYLVLEIESAKVLCVELEQIFDDNYDLVFAPFSIEEASIDGKTNFCFYLIFDQEGFLRSGQNSLYVLSTVDPADCSTKNFTYSPLRETVFCALCDKSNVNCIETGPLSSIYEDQSGKILWAHAYCFALSPKLPDETVAAFLKRCSHTSCNHCKRRNASLYCEKKKCCSRKYHLECAIASGCEYMESTGVFVCEQHLAPYCQEHQELIGFPPGTAVYLRYSDWSLISERDVKKIVAFSRHYQPLLVHWFRRSFYDFVRVVEIDRGDWAFDEQFPSKKQYGIVARKTIVKGVIFGEYTGRVHYDGDPAVAKSAYCAKIFLPEAAAKTIPPLVIDGQDFGNEMRFINSVAPWTPAEIKANVHFVTYWVAGRPRIMLEALDTVSEGQTVILDYGKEYFEEAEAT